MSNAGIELLINNNNKMSNKSIGDFDDLEYELNELNDSKNISEIDFDIGRETINESANLDDYNDINIKFAEQDYEEPSMKREDVLKEKFEIYGKLMMLEKNGVQLTKHYTMESSLVEMKMEYALHMDDRKKKSSILFYRNALKNCIHGLEILNGQFNPFDVDLDGWHDQIEENIENYDDVFEELYEKYKDKGKIMPEIKLILQLGGSAAMLAFSNKMMKNVVPGAEEIFRNNPDLAAGFKDALSREMNKNSSGFGNLMGSISGRQGPPAPINTKEYSDRDYIDRGGNNNTRPDISMAQSVYLPRQQPQSSKDLMRPEMNGPKDISNILSGLKTKTLQNPQQPKAISPTPSVIESDAKPKRSKRRTTGSRNTMSLDL
jgi:hypothetical protein